MVLSKTLPSEAAVVLEKGVRKMTPKIMTWGQYTSAALNYIHQTLASMAGWEVPEAYQPDYTKCAGALIHYAATGACSCRDGWAINMD